LKNTPTFMYVFPHFRKKEADSIWLKAKIRENTSTSTISYSSNVMCIACIACDTFPTSKKQHCFWCMYAWIFFLFVNTGAHLFSW
jgi:hypothetical protein